ERNLVPAERGSAQRLVDEPGEHEACERDGRGDRRRQVEHGFVDEIEFRAEIVDDHQQREAGKPGGIGFPLEPGQLIGHAAGAMRYFTMWKKPPPWTCQASPWTPCGRPDRALRLRSRWMK